MSVQTIENTKLKIKLTLVNEGNWRSIAKLRVKPSQTKFVADPCYYLAMCHYGNIWRPLAVTLNDLIIGFLMWAVDESDQSCWLGGIIIDHNHQGLGYGYQTIKAAISLLSLKKGFQRFALSYSPNNPAKNLYSKIGFIETDEWEADEVVARYTISAASA